MDRITAQKVVDELSLLYTDKPALNFKTEYQLLVAVILSAQCTDERVNKVTAKLFEKYPDPKDILTLSEEQLGKMIFSCGLYNSKAKHILSATRDIVEKFGGKVPSNLEDLRSLDGVGRKTANVVYSVGFKGNAIAVDTHVFRVANRIGLSNASDVLNTEKQLMSILDEDVWSKSHHYLIYHGRNVCKSQRPDCQNCSINYLCEKNFKAKSTIKK